MVNDLMLSDKLDTISSSLSGGESSKDGLFLFYFSFSFKE
jgi:hypothetical protein